MILLEPVTGPLRTIKVLMLATSQENIFVALEAPAAIVSDTRRDAPLELADIHIIDVDDCHKDERHELLPSLAC